MLKDFLQKTMSFITVNLNSTEYLLSLLSPLLLLLHSSGCGAGTASLATPPPTGQTGRGGAGVAEASLLAVEHHPQARPGQG